MEKRIFQYDKLCRDKMIEILTQGGSTVHVEELDDAEYDIALRVKMLEEADELLRSESAEEFKQELADLQEVIDALCALHEIDKRQVQAVQKQKREQRGGFDNRVFIAVVEHPKGSAGEQYCLADPERYPEITE